MLSQVYVPDPASVGQHMHDAAAEIVRRGHEALVLCSARGYDDPTKRYAARETREGVDIRRMPLSSFGKKTILHRLAGQGLFIAQILLRGLLSRHDAILVSTSPPMCSLVAVVIRTIRRKPIVYWAMDINPDQVLAMGVMRPGSMPVRAMDWLNRRILGCAHTVVALDRFMAERLRAKRDIPGLLHVDPPWPHDDHIETIDHADNPFRRDHTLGDGRAPGSKFVVMYSGNHSPANPLDTILAAADRLRQRHDIVFLFIGGGKAKKQVEDAIARGSTNIRSLPYQPIETLKYSLSAADVHVVSVGDDVVGIVHPCKIYGSMSVARPVLTFGPVPSHVSDLVQGLKIGFHHAHGDVDGAVRSIEALATMSAAQRAELGARAGAAAGDRYSKRTLCTRFGDLVEDALLGRAPCSAGTPGPDLTPTTPTPAAAPHA